jgi:hypothetical protein
MAAERIGVHAVEAFFRESRLACAVARALMRFFGDQEAVRSLKKGYHVSYEYRLRTLALRAEGARLDEWNDIPIVPDWHPLDRHAARDLEAVVTGVAAPAFAVHVALTVCQFAIALYQAFKLLRVALSWLLRYGVARCAPVRCRVASPNFWNADRLGGLKEASNDLGIDLVDHLVFVMECADCQDVRGVFRTLDPDNLPVPRGRWIRRVVAPAIRLVAELVPLSLLALRDTRCLELVVESLRQARYGLHVWRIAFNVSFESYLDITEYRAQHNIKAIVFQKFGGRLVRVPHSQMDSPGSVLSYLGYHVFLSGGDYQRETYGHSWSPRVRCLSVGLFQKDRRMSRSVDLSIAAAVEERLREGRRLAVFFSSGLVVGRAAVLDALAALRSAVSETDSWVVVIKPKGMREAMYDWMESDPRLAHWLHSPCVVAVHYDRPDIERCPVGWLIDRMDFGVCLGGSVQVEALTSGIPVFAHQLVWQDTPYTRALVEYGFLHADGKSLERALCQYVSDPGSFKIHFDRFQQWFDPFGDDQAWVRIAGVLLGSEVIHPYSAGGLAYEATSVTVEDRRGS